MKTRQSILKYVCLIGLSLVLSMSCSKDEVSKDPLAPNIDSTELAEFNVAVQKLQAFDQPSESAIEEISTTDAERDTEDRSLECNATTFKGSPGYDELFTLDPTTDVIYPGALLIGGSIPTGEYIGISAKRAPITISSSLVGITGSSSIVIDDPNKLSEVREGVNTLLSQEVTGATPAEISLDISEIYSEEHMSVEVGANYRGVTKKVSANLKYESSTYENTFVLKFIQKYFTLDLDSPGESPSDLFTELPNMDTFGSTSPVYVASVTYGRMVLYTVESNSTLREVELAFEASMASTDGNIDAAYETVLNTSNIQALIIGGSGDGAVKAIRGPEGVYSFIEQGGNYSKDSPGAPLAYKLRYVTNGFPVAKVVLATEYQVRGCELAYPEYQVNIEKITGTQPSDTEVYGYLKMKLKANNKYIDMNNNGTDDGPSWGADSDESVDVQNDKTYRVNKDYVFKPYRPNQSVDQIEYYGELKDYNGVIIADALLGDKKGSVKLNELTLNVEQTKTLRFDDGITVHFTLVRIK